MRKYFKPNIKYIQSVPRITKFYQILFSFIVESLEFQFLKHQVPSLMFCNFHQHTCSATRLKTVRSKNLKRVEETGSGRNKNLLVFLEVFGSILFNSHMVRNLMVFVKYMIFLLSWYLTYRIKEGTST